jgi:RHS repeat-associated protein
LVINSSGMVIENNRTLPYGEAWLAENTPSTNDKKFTTYQRDAESGLDYAMKRYFANSSGRFVSVDKGRLGLNTPQTLNRYIYATNDPVNLLDPDGNEIQCPQGSDGIYTCIPQPVIPFVAVFGFGYPVYTGGEFGMYSAAYFEAAGAAAMQQATQEALWQALSGAYSIALNALQKPECASLFNTSGNGMNPATVLSRMYTTVGATSGIIDIRSLGAGRDGQTQVDPSANYQGQENGRDVWDKVNIVINSDTWLLMSGADRARFLIHELGHVFNLLAGAGGSEFQNDVNPDNTPNMAAQKHNADLERKCIP